MVSPGCRLLSSSVLSPGAVLLPLETIAGNCEYAGNPAKNVGLALAEVSIKVHEVKETYTSENKSLLLPLESR